MIIIGKMISNLDKILQKTINQRDSRKLNIILAYLKEWPFLFKKLSIPEIENYKALLDAELKNEEENYNADFSAEEILKFYGDFALLGIPTSLITGFTAAIIEEFFKSGLPQNKKLLIVPILSSSISIALSIKLFNHWYDFTTKSKLKNSLENLKIMKKNLDIFYKYTLLVNKIAEPKELNFSN